MRGDLNEQFQRAQMYGNDDDTSKKVIIGVAVFVAVCMILMIVAVTVFVARSFDKFIDAEPATKIDPNSVSKVGDLADKVDRLSGGTGVSGRNSSETSTLNGSANPSFTYGAVSGTSYYSAFSGVSFTAPNDWMLTSYSNSVPSSSPRDMTATGSSLTSSVVIQYESIRNHNYKTVEDALNTAKLTANSTGNQMVNQKVSEKWGGNKFTGIIYKTTAMNFDTYYEVLVAEVNGYVLKITIAGASEKELATVRGYFK